MIPSKIEGSYGEVELRVCLNLRLTKGDERGDEWLAAVDAEAALVVEERVGGGAAVAHGQQVLRVVEGLGADGHAAQVDGLLEARRHPQRLQLLVGVARQLEPTQVLGLLGHRVQCRHLPAEKCVKFLLFTIYT